MEDLFQNQLDDLPTIKSYVELLIATARLAGHNPNADVKIVTIELYGGKLHIVTPYGTTLPKVIIYGNGVQFTKVIKQQIPGAYYDSLNDMVVLFKLEDKDLDNATYIEELFKQILQLL